jgi:DNA-binding transcriptional MerR regulator
VPTIILEAPEMTNRDDGCDRDETEIVWVDDSGAVPPPPEGTVLSIGNIAKMFNVSRLALRNYEVRGLIKRRHRVGHTRVYGWADCDRIAFIIKGRKAGLTLAELAPILKAADEDASVDSMRAGRTACLELIDRLDRRRQALRDGLAELRHIHTLLSSKLLTGRDREPG